MVLVAAGLVMPAAGLAQGGGQAPCQLCAPTVDGTNDQQPDTPLRLELQTRLDFDSIIFGGDGEALMSLSPEGSAQIFGAASATGARAMPGSVVIRGDPGRQVRIDIPSRIHLFGEFGGTVRIDRIVTDLPSFPRIGDDGVLSFRFGGDVRISGETDGAYRGSVDFIVDYL